MAGPKDVAKILLEYDYPVWCVHDEDAPRAMWEDLGRELGLEHVWLGGSIKARQKRRKCSKCGKYYVGHPALSRKYNKTEILFGVWSEGGSCGF